MNGAFECTHCGACCKKETSPINLSLGDISRLAEFLKKKPSELIGKEIKMRPFVNPQEPGKFDIELGLPKPCPFWKDNKCSVYEARPLNCRLFPFWLFATLTEEEIKEQTLPEYECVINSKIDEPHKNIYKEYTKKIGAMIMREARATDEFLRENNLTQSVSLTDKHELVLKVLEGPGPGTEQTFIELVRIGESRMDKEKYAHLPEIIENQLNNKDIQSSFASEDELNQAEQILSKGCVRK